MLFIFLAVTMLSFTLVNWSESFLVLLYINCPTLKKMEMFRHGRESSTVSEVRKSISNERRWIAEGGVHLCPLTCHCILCSTLISCNCAESGLPPSLIRLFTAFLLRGHSWSRGGVGDTFVQIACDKSLQNTIREMISMEWTLHLCVVPWFLSPLPFTSSKRPYLSNLTKSAFVPPYQLLVCVSLHQTCLISIFPPPTTLSPPVVRLSPYGSSKASVNIYHCAFSFNAWPAS